MGLSTEEGREIVSLMLADAYMKRDLEVAGVGGSVDVKDSESAIQKGWHILLLDTSAWVASFRCSPDISLLSSSPNYFLQNAGESIATER